MQTTSRKTLLQVDHCSLLTTASISATDDMEAIPVKHFVKHIMELYKNNLQGFSEEFEVLKFSHCLLGMYDSYVFSVR